MNRKRNDDFNAYLHEQLKDPMFAAVYEEEAEKVDLAIKLLKIRQTAGLSQKELAERIGTTQSVIARMENPEYSGYSVRMLRRIAAALGARLTIDFRPLKKTASNSRRRRVARRVAV
jgi:transcriptional regulator with XRE-family HTH domain